MRDRYLYVAPRGFANEHIIYSVSLTDTVQKFKARTIIAQYENDTNARVYYIPREKAERIIAANRQAYKPGDADHDTPVKCTEIISITEYKIEGDALNDMCKND